MIRAGHTLWQLYCCCTRLQYVALWVNFVGDNFGARNATRQQLQPRAWSTSARAFSVNHFSSNLKSSSTWWHCWMISNKRPILNLRIGRKAKSSCLVPTFPRFTRRWMELSKSLSASCCCPGSLVHFSRRSKRTTDNTSVSFKELKSSLSFLLSLDFGFWCPRWQNWQKKPLTHLA